jgi:methyltransferase (TIGR00027 family)
MVDADRASWTARHAAYVRAYHYAHDSPRVFEDFLAGTLITSAERTTIEENWLASLARLSPELAAAGDRETALAQWFHTWIPEPVVLGRARYNEEKLSDAIRNGISQYVIVGAGLETFALRRPDLQNRLRVFELDHPVTQALKRDRLGRAALAVPPNLHFCPIDFERESVASALARSPHDPALPTFFSWLGVTYYLTRQAISNTLTSIRTVAGPGSEIVLDYADSVMFLPENQSPALRALFNWAESLGEPFISGFDPGTFDEELAALGFEVLEDLDHEAQEARYFASRADGLRPVVPTHFAHARLGGHGTESHQPARVPKVES